MNDQLFQQAGQFFKPMTEMMALNARTFEALAEKQTGLMSSMWSDGLNYAKELSDKRDMQSFYESQRDFWDGFNQKLSSTAKDSYNLLTEAQEEMGRLVQDSMSSVDMASAVEPFMQGAYKAQGAAQQTAEAAAETTQKAQSQAAKTAKTEKASGKAGQSSQNTAPNK